MVILQYIHLSTTIDSYTRGIVAYAIGNRKNIKFVKNFLGNRSIESFHSSLK